MDQEFEKNWRKVGSELRFVLKTSTSWSVGLKVSLYFWWEWTPDCSQKEVDIECFGVWGTYILGNKHMQYWLENRAFEVSVAIPNWMIPEITTKKHVLQFMFIDQTIGWHVGNYLQVHFLISTWDLSCVQPCIWWSLEVGNMFIYIYIHQKIYTCKKVSSTEGQLTILASKKQKRVHKLLQVKRSDAVDGWEIPKANHPGM